MSLLPNKAIWNGEGQKYSELADKPCYRAHPLTSNHTVGKAQVWKASMEELAWAISLFRQALTFPPVSCIPIKVMGKTKKKKNQVIRFTPQTVYTKQTLQAKCAEYSNAKSPHYTELE